eukprot:6081665-Pyramimonas_sp.AAC.2
MSLPSAYAVASSANEKKWLESTLAEMYPGLEGNELQTRVFQDYLMDPANPNVRLPLFNKKGLPVFHRHTINNRNYKAHRENLVKGILQSGLLEGVRGEAWALPTADDVTSLKDLAANAGADMGCQMQLLSHATLVEAIYEAHKRSPDNKFVKQTLAIGVSCKVFFGRTPQFICQYLKDLHNQFHRGAQKSFIEKYESAHSHEKEWAAHCRAKGICARALPTKGPDTYMKQYWKWLQENHPGDFRTWT